MFNSIRSYQIPSWKAALIKLLGGFDPVAVGFLVHRAWLLTSVAESSTRSKGWEKLLRFHMAATRKAISNADPMFAYIRGYRSGGRESSVSEVERAPRRGDEGTSPDGISAVVTKTREFTRVVDPPRAEIRSGG